MVDPRYDPAFQRGYVPPPAKVPWPVAPLVFSTVLIAVGTVAFLVPSPAIAISVADYVAPLVLAAVAPWLLAVGVAAFLASVVVRSVSR